MGKLYISDKFGQTPNELLNKKEVSLKAKGLFAYLQSKPEGWEFSAKRISKESKEGPAAVRTGLKELEEHKYLTRKPVKDKKGKWNGYDYTLHLKPKDCPSCDYPQTDNPSTDNPSTENHPTLSKKEESKKEESKKEEESKDSRKDEKKIMDFFYENINPELPYAHKTQWKAITNMIDKYGLDAVMKLSEYVATIQDKKYAPNVTTPYQMKKNMAKIINHYKRNKSSNERIVI